jgi:hypothetical protein|tara:strand:+ start:438 stop:818 length:381 start_codon:yes stop_codon:yes gene_type:complete
MENRGRPSEQVEKLDKWVLDTETSIWKYDVNKNPNGCYLVEQKFIAGEKQNKLDIDQRRYGKTPVVMVFKTSNRSNARTKLKVFNKNIDYIITAKKLPGVPEKAVILELGVGDTFINEYKQKYNLT